MEDKENILGLFDQCIKLQDAFFKFDSFGLIVRRYLKDRDSTLIVTKNTSLTSSEFLILVVYYANFIRRFGVKEKSVVGVCCREELLLLIANFSITSLGGIIKSIRPEEPPSESDLCDFIVTDDPNTNINDTCAAIYIDYSLYKRALCSEFVDCSISWGATCKNLDDPMIIGNTSSTTGNKKTFLLRVKLSKIDQTSTTPDFLKKTSILFQFTATAMVLHMSPLCAPFILEVRSLFQTLINFMMTVSHTPTATQLCYLAMLLD